jgi:hypothetical protein
MSNRKFKSPTHGDLTIEQVPEKILLYFEKMKEYDSKFSIIVGTDSQNFSDTKMVSVIAVTCEGHGGIFFYNITRQPIIKDVRTKLHIETEESLELASELVRLIEDKEEYEELYMNCSFAIHIDAGNSEKGKTKELIPELVGWIKACGYDCEVKPNSYVASSIADKISK